MTAKKTKKNERGIHVGVTNEACVAVWKSTGRTKKDRNVSETARQLGISRTAVVWHLRRAGVL